MKTVLNDLYDYGLKIYQLEDAFKFSLDSLLLAEFVKVKNKQEIILDLCTGNASIPLVLSTKYSNQIYGIELQKDIFTLANNSVKYNKKDKQINIIQANVKVSLDYFPKESIDIITCNPPYFKFQENSIINNSSLKAIARHEVKIKIAEIVQISANLLKHNGRFYLIHLAERLDEIIIELNKNNLNLKRLVPIYTNKNKNCNLVLIEAIKGSKKGLKILPALYSENLKTFKNIF